MKLLKLIEKLIDIECDTDEVLEVSANKICDIPFLILKKENGKILEVINLSE